MVQKGNVVTYPVVYALEDDSGYSVRVPDVNALSQGDNFQEATVMVQEAVGLTLEDKTEYPDASQPQDVELEEWENPKTTIVAMVVFDLAEYRRNQSKTVRRNISIPEYLNNIAKKQNINVSKVATEALESIVFN